jgi:aspartate/methionine/tyrosine aminotransferase
MKEYHREETNVDITDGSLFDKQGKGHIRISFAEHGESG